MVEESKDQSSSPSQVVNDENVDSVREGVRNLNIQGDDNKMFSCETKIDLTDDVLKEIGQESNNKILNIIE